MPAPARHPLRRPLPFILLPVRMVHDLREISPPVSRRKGIGVGALLLKIEIYIPKYLSQGPRESWKGGEFVWHRVQFPNAS